MKKIILSLFLLLFSNAYALENINKKYSILLDLNDKAKIVTIGNSGFTNQNKYIDLKSWGVESEFKKSLKNRFFNTFKSNIQILNINHFEIPKPTLDFEFIFGNDDDKINLILNKVSSLGTEYLLILKSNETNAVTHGTYAAPLDGYGFYGDERSGTYDHRLYNSNASYFSLRVYIFDLKNQKFNGKEHVYNYKYYYSDRDLTNSEKDEVLQLITEEEFEEDMISNYKKLIFKENINKKEILNYYKKNNSHLEQEDLEDNMWYLTRALYSLHHTANNFHLLSDIEKEKLKKHFINMLSDVSYDLINLMEIDPVGFKVEQIEAVF